MKNHNLSKVNENEPGYNPQISGSLGQIDACSFDVDGQIQMGTEATLETKLMN